MILHLQDVREMLRLTRGGLRASVQDEEVRLPDLTAKVTTKREYPVFLKVDQPVVEEDKDGTAGENR